MRKKGKVGWDQAKKAKRNRTGASTGREQELKTTEKSNVREMTGQEQSERIVREISKNREQLVPVWESKLGDRRPWTLCGRSLEPSCMDIPRERLGGRPGRELKRDRE